MGASLAGIPNPKPRGQSQKRSHWYPYYAGYCPQFVEGVIDLLSLDASHLVLDPWNGAGTTTAVCQSRSIRAWGVDLNPVMVVVGRARLLRDDAVGSLHALLGAILADAQGGLRRTSSPHEPLTSWFDGASAARLRSVERSIRRALCDSADLGVLDRVARLSKLASFFYVLCFRVTRELLGDRVTTKNPTWLRSELAASHKVNATWSDIQEVAERELAKMEASHKLAPAQWVECDVQIGSSTEIEELGFTASTIIGSPPYFTRIDYAVATRVELAFLGVDAGQFDAIRGSLLGGAKNSISEAALPEFDLSLEILDKITGHESKASGAYYRQYYARFLRGYEDSMSGVARACSPGGDVVLVVQDSMYKDIHLDLASLSIHLLEVAGLHLEDRKDFGCATSLRHKNRSAQSYAKSWRASESVLWFRRAL